MSVLSITNLLFIVILTTYYNGYSTWFDFIVVGIPWTFLYWLYALLLTSSIYIINAYVFVISLVVRIRIRRLVASIERDKVFKIQKESGKKFVWKTTRIIELNQIIVQVREYNRFWRSAITILILWRILIINFVAYLIFFANLPHIVHVQYTLILFNEFSFFIFYLYQAASVWKEFEILRKRMQTRLAITFGRKKIKVSLKEFHKFNLISVGIEFCRDTFQRRWLAFLEQRSH